MTQPTYSVYAPDQQRLKIARMEIEAVIQKHDLAGVVVLHTPGMAEFFYQIGPSYSVLQIDEKAQAVRIKSKLDADHGGDVDAQKKMMQQCTANMTACLAGELRHAAMMFIDVNEFVATALRAESSASVFVPDPGESKLQ